MVVGAYEGCLWWSVPIVVRTFGVCLLWSVPLVRAYSGPYLWCVSIEVRTFGVCLWWWVPIMVRTECLAGRLSTRQGEVFFATHIIKTVRSF